MNRPLPYSRRSFLKTLAGGSLLLHPLLAYSADRFQRINPQIRGVGLTTFSLRPLMRYWWGRPTEGHMDIVDFLDYCAEHGVEAAELTSYFFRTPVERSYINEIRRRAHVLGINLVAGAIGNNFSHPPGSEQAKQQLEYTYTWIDHFSEMGIPVIRVFAGNPPDGVSVDQAVENVVANMEEALAYSEKRGVMLGIENHNIARNVDRLLEIVERIDSKWFGITFDSANLEPTPDPYGELERIAPYTISAQIKVMIPVEGEYQLTDFDRIVAILRDAGYAGYLILEYEEDEDPLTAVPRYLNELEKALASS